MLEWTRGNSIEAKPASARAPDVARARPAGGRGLYWPARLLKPAAFLVLCLPLVKLGADALAGHLGPNPIAEGMNRLGFWTLTFLGLSLVPTPAKQLFGLTWPMRIRRMLGLFAFTYALLHFAWYLGVDQFFAFGEILKDVAKRKFITVGFAAFVLLVPLAATSTDRAVRRMGFRRWKRLHRLAYVAALLGVVHFVWRVKADLLQPAIFAAAIGMLLLTRAAVWIRRRASA